MIKCTVDWLSPRTTISIFPDHHSWDWADSRHDDHDGVGDINLFKSDGDFASYCRVDARRLSNGKCKAENNQKCGNKYLA
jgi:hypothetical protein